MTLYAKSRNSEVISEENIFKRSKNQKLTLPFCLLFDQNEMKLHSVYIFLPALVPIGTTVYKYFLIGQ